MRGLGLILATAMLVAVPATATAAPADVAAAVANATVRTADNVKLDEGRKPAEVLQFLGLETGMQAIDLFGGNRYWAEIMAPAVGPKGHVTVWEPTQFYDKASQEKFAEFQQKAPNAHLIVSPFEAMTLEPNAYDFMMINLNYHDVYWESAKYGVKRMEPDVFLKTVFDGDEAGRDRRRHRPCRRARRHAPDRREGPPHRSGRGQGGLRARRLQAGGRKRPAEESG